MNEGTLAARIEIIERGYEYLLAYAAQGRQDDAGTELRATLGGMREALSGLAPLVSAAFGSLPGNAGHFMQAVERDVAVALGAMDIVMSRRLIPSLLIDNLNASVHLRALLTDLFLLDQASRSPANDTAEAAG